MAVPARRSATSDAHVAPGVRTFLIADIRGYTRFTQAHGDAAAARLAERFAEVAREVVAARGGDVIELRGDEALAVFGSARQAIRAATELQAALAEERAADPLLPLVAGIGLDAGEALPVEGGFRGAALNLAARLCAMAGPGETLASDGVVHLARAIDGIRFEGAGTETFKGIDAPVQVVRIASTAAVPDEPVARPAPSPTELPVGLDATTVPLIGRQQELWWLRGSWRLARRGQGRLVAISGPPGMGRTRLAAELARSVYDEGATVRYVDLSAEPGALAGLPASLAVTAPTLLVVEDLETAEPAALGRLAILGTEGIEAPVLVVATCRDDLPAPALADLLARLHSADAHWPLGPLDADAVLAIVGTYSGRSTTEIPVTTILEASGGIPAAVHALAAEWARTDASRRLGTAATRASAGRRELRAIEAELADNVIDLQQIRERTRLVASAPEAAGEICPFKGLAPFETADADLFFGRERLIAEIVARLVGTTFLGVVGPSGSGKSSVVRAGLLPALAGGVLPGSDGWRQALFRPGAEPLEAFRRAVGAPDGADPVHVLLAAAPDQRVVVAVDQFEEVFTACTDEATRADFLGALVRLATDPDRRAKVVVALRADFYGRCALYPALADLLATGHVLVGPMQADELRRAIELPAQRAGLLIEPTLVDALVADVADEPGALPLLSTALLELWARRDGRTLRLATYEQTGGVRGAVARMAEEAYASLQAPQQPMARAVLLRLATEDESRRIARRRAPLSEFDADDTAVAEVIAALTARRLLTVDEGSLEVAHEALLREWPRLAGWLDEDAQGRGLRRHLTASAHDWEAAGRDPGELYRGARLASALDWTAEHEAELNALEREFLADSRAATEREAERARRVNRRLRMLLVASVAGLAIAVLAGGFAFVQQGEAERAADAAEDQRAEAETQRVAAEAQRAAAERARLEADAQRVGALALTEGALDRSLLLAREAYALDPSVETRSTLLAALQRAPAAVAVLHGGGDVIQWLDMPADGSVVIAQDNLGRVFFWDTATGELRPSGAALYANLFGHDISPDGRTMVAATGDSTELYAVDITAPLVGIDRRTRLSAEVGSLAFTGDGSVLVTLEAVPERPGGRQLVLRDPTDLRPTGRTIPVAGGDGGTILVAVGTGRIAYGLRPDDGSAGVTRVIDLGTGRVDVEVPFSGPIAVSPDQRDLAIGLDDGALVVVDLGTGRSRVGVRGHSATVTGLAYTPDGRTLVSTGLDRAVVAWDAGALTIREVLRGHTGPVFGPVISPDGRTAYTGSTDGLVVAWDLAGDRRLVRPFSLDAAAPPGFWVHLATVAGDGRTLVYALPDGRVRLHDLVSGADRDVELWDRASAIAAGAPATGSEPSFEITSVTAQPGGTLVALTSDLPVPVLLDVATGTIQRLEGGHVDGFTSSAAFTADGRLLATGGEDEHVVIWDVGAATVRTSIRPAFGFATALAFDPSGSLLAVGSTGGPGFGDVVIWDLEQDRSYLGRSLNVDAWNTWSLRFTDDGRQLVATGEQTGNVSIWDAGAGELLGSIPAHAGAAIDALVIPSGPYLASAGTDGVARLWDPESRQAIGTPLTVRQGELRYARVSISLIDDGRSLVVVDDRGNGAIWPLDESVWAAHACAVAGRTLDEAELDLYLAGRTEPAGCTD